MTRRITLPDLDEKLVAVEYEQHEYEFMVQLRGQLDGPDASWARASIQTLHHLKAIFPGSQLVLEEEVEHPITWGTDESVHRRWTDVAEETRGAIKRVDENADDEWKQTALEAVRRTCEQLPEFISDDIWDQGLDSTREDRALGPILMKAKKEGWCVKTDRLRPSVRSHLSGKPVWKSLLFQEEQLLFGMEDDEAS